MPPYEFDALRNLGSGDIKYSRTWFSNWFDEVHIKVVEGGMVPTLDESQRVALLNACIKLQEATKDMDGGSSLQLLPPSLEKTKGLPNKQDKGMVEAIKKARRFFADVATPILEGMDDVLEALDLDNPNVLQWLVFIQSSPSKLADYCRQASDQHIDKLMNLLEGDNLPLLKQMMLYGGAKGGNYGKAINMYHDIGDRMHTDKSILPKLQLAVALELCQPLPIFDTFTPINGVQRYFEYEKAYLEGLLDPAFEQFSVWELRMVVDSNASDEELEWCRQMMLAYRPDFCYMKDQRWRYSNIVKTDVKFKHPDWKQRPKDMYQTIARGGKCGVRALFGRFANKAFGIPTWGLEQPDHDAMAKWTPTGWVCCLGENDMGHWQGRDYLDFTYEAFIRKNMGDEFYCRKVDLLMWMALAERDNGSKSAVDLWNHRPDTPWVNLAQLQRNRWGNTGKPFLRPDSFQFQCEVLTKITQLQQQKATKHEEIIVEENGTIFVPVSAHEGAKNIVFAKSLLGGMQFNVDDENWWIEYRIPADKLPDERKTYKLTMRVSSPHDNDPNPFQWIVTCLGHHQPGQQPIKEYIVPCSYTKGLWVDTESVEVELGGGGDVKLKLMRQIPCWPVTVKSFQLSPTL